MAGNLSACSILQCSSTIEQELRASHDQAGRVRVLDPMAVNAVKISNTGDCLTPSASLLGRLGAAAIQVLE